MTKNVACLLAVGLIASCAAGGTGTRSDGKASDGAKGSEANSASAQSSTGDPAKIEFESAEPRAVTLVEFVGGNLTLGFSDGVISTFDLSSKKASQSKVASAHAVAAVSSSGELALLDSNPPAIVNLEGELILQMNHVQEFESAAFGADGVALYVADKGGKIRVWGQPHSFEEDQHKERLENYLNRQAPDFHVEFPPIRGPIAVTPANQVIVTDESGIVNLWDPTRPSNAKRIMKIDGQVRSIVAAEDFIYVTSTHGALKIGKTDGTGYLPWSKDARGGFVAATGLASTTYWQLDDGAISSRNTEDGSALWERKLPTGHLCGLAASRDAQWLAACVGNRVVLMSAKDGAAAGYMYWNGKDFAWRAQ